MHCVVGKQTLHQREIQFWMIPPKQQYFAMKFQECFLDKNLEKNLMFWSDTQCTIPKATKMIYTLFIYFSF